MSVATREDLASFRLSHSQDVLQFHKVVQFGFLLRRQAVLFLALNQLGNSLLRLR
jgi:hypothetical protein